LDAKVTTRSNSGNWPTGNENFSITGKILIPNSVCESQDIKLLLDAEWYCSHHREKHWHWSKISNEMRSDNSQYLKKSVSRIDLAEIDLYNYEMAKCIMSNFIKLCSFRWTSINISKDSLRCVLLLINDNIPIDQL